MFGIGPIEMLIVGLFCVGTMTAGIVLVICAHHSEPAEFVIGIVPRLR